MPSGEQAAGFVERRPDDAAVRDSRSALMVLAEAHHRPVPLDAFDLRQRHPQAELVVAATEAPRVVVGRDSAQRRPPRSWCARKKFSEPAVAIALEAEISSASAAAAMIWANR